VPTEKYWNVVFENSEMLIMHGTQVEIPSIPCVQRTIIDPAEEDSYDMLSRLLHVRDHFAIGVVSPFRSPVANCMPASKCRRKSGFQ